MALRQLAAGQSPYALVNGLFTAGVPATTLGIDTIGTSGLTLSIYGGKVLVGGTVTSLADRDSLAVTASATNYIEFDPSATGTTSGIKINTTGWTPGYWPLYTVTTDGSGVTGYVDYRTWGAPAHPILTVNFASDANKTLTQAEARADILKLTSVSLSTTRNLVVPLVAKMWVVVNGTTGSQSIQVIGASGTGITIGNAKAAIVASDGTNVFRVTADA